MIKQEKELKIKVPTKVEEVTVGQMQSYINYLSRYSEEEAKEHAEEIKINMVSIFCNIPIMVVRTMINAKDIESLAEKVDTILNVLLGKDVKGLFEKRFKSHNREWGFEPDFENMPSGAFADLSTYHNDWDMAHRAMAVLYRPVTKVKRNKWLKIEQYDIEKYNGTSKWGEMMKQLPVMYLIGANFFLTNSFQKLQIPFLVYLEKKVQEKGEISTALNNSSKISGDGIQLSMQLLTTSHYK